MKRALQKRLGLALISIAAAAMDAPLAAEPPKPGFEVVDGGWGRAESVQVGKIIAAVAEEFPAVGPPAPIRIRHSFDGPTIRYDRDHDGGIVMQLSARDDRWYRYVYQFAHEYCHVLSNFERKQSGRDIVREHQWFEESLCETASLYALRRLAVKWCDPAADPPFREGAAQLARYAAQLLAEPHRRLGTGIDFATWYSRNERQLRSNPYYREASELAAIQLLPLFEEDPGRWRALAYLNPAIPSPGQSFSDFLSAWGAASPSELKPVVAEIQALFGLQPASAPMSANVDPLRTRRQRGKEPGCGS